MNFGRVTPKFVSCQKRKQKRRCDVRMFVGVYVCFSVLHCVATATTYWVHWDSFLILAFNVLFECSFSIVLPGFQHFWLWTRFICFLFFFTCDWLASILRVCFSLYLLVDNFGWFLVTFLSFVLKFFAFLFCALVLVRFIFACSSRTILI